MQLLFLLLAVMMVMLLVGIPVGYTLFAIGFIGLYLSLGWDPSVASLVSVTYSQTTSYLFATIPMFILMAEFLNKSGLLDDVFEATYRWTSRIPGGLAVTTTISNGGFASLTGSSTASAAAMAKLAVPEMRKYGYSDRMSMGTVAASGTFAMMFPPSIGLIVYGVLTENSIAALFVAGIIPGLLTLGIYIVLIIAWVKINPDVMGEKPPAFSWREKFASLKPVWPALLLLLLVLGSLYLGIVTPTESGALGAAGALAIGVLIYGLSARNVYDALVDTAKITTMIYMIILGAMVFSRYLAASGVTAQLIQAVNDLPVGRYSVLLLILFLYLFLGMIMNQSSILVLTLPITYPLIVTGLDFHPIWFGIFVIKAAEIGMITPPLGLNVYVAGNMVDVDIGEAFDGALRFIFADTVVLLLLVVFPIIALWLPGRM